MRAVRNTTELLILEGASPLFRPFFLGGLGLLVLGATLLIGGPLLGRAAGGSPPGADDAVPIAGLGVFLATFGFFVAVVPLAGRFPYRREIIVDRAAGRFVRRDRTLLRLRQESYPLDEVRGIEVEEARHVDGDPYFSLLLLLESGESATLDRFTDRTTAGLVARLIRDHLGPAICPERDRAGRPDG
jgi:hypothetical protein